LKSSYIKFNLPLKNQRIFKKEKISIGVLEVEQYKEIKNNMEKQEIIFGKIKKGKKRDQ